MGEAAIHDRKSVIAFPKKDFVSSSSPAIRVQGEIAEGNDEPSSEFVQSVLAGLQSWRDQNDLSSRRTTHVGHVHDIRKWQHPLCFH
jgi:hypothetical protein